MIEENLVKKLIASLECGHCGQHYEVDNVDIIGQEENSWFLNVFCSACQTQCLVAAIVKDNGTPKVITDLTEAELETFRNVSAVTADDVLDMHIFLKGFSGDFFSLFQKS